MKKSIVIVQARMGSERCPGKSMELIGGVPVVELVLRRLSKAKNIDGVVLATSVLDRDDILARHAENAGFDVFRGSEADLVGRFVAATKQFSNSNYIVRATGDNVFMDWNEIDRLIEYGKTGDYDFVGFENKVYPDRINDFSGEFIKKEALEKVASLTNDPFDREHVFPYFYSHQNMFKVDKIQVDSSLHTPVKLDLDYPEDLQMLKQIGKEVDNPVDVPATEVVKIANRLSGVDVT